MKIPISKPYFTGREKTMVLKPLASGWVAQGPYVEQLERNFCRYTGARYAIAVSSCTAAQFIASHCIGLKPGDEVLVPAFTWVSTANAIEAIGAKPVFVDIDLETFNIDVKALEKSITSKTRAIAPVHLFGLPADMDKIGAIAHRYRLKIIEDAACALGGKIGMQHVGTFGDCGCFSFHARKAITTGEGGMLITDSKDIALQARSLRNHGAEFISSKRRRAGLSNILLPGFDSMGYNYRLTDIQAAIGIAQMEKLAYMLKRRKWLAHIYRKCLSDVFDLALPSISGDVTHSFQSFVCLFELHAIRKLLDSRDYRRIDALSHKRNNIMKKLLASGISTRQGTHAVHIQSYYSKKYRIDKFDFPHAYIADRLSIALPLYVQMTPKEQVYVIDTLKRALI